MCGSAGRPRASHALVFPSDVGAGRVVDRGRVTSKCSRSRPGAGDGQEEILKK